MSEELKAGATGFSGPGFAKPILVDDYGVQASTGPDPFLG